MADLETGIDVIKLKIFSGQTTDAKLIGEVLGTTTGHPFPLILTLSFTR